MALSTWTDQQITSQLNSGTKWTGQTITYSFAQDWRFDIPSPNGEITGFTPLSAGGQAKAALALKLWDDLIVNSITNVAPGSGASDLEFGMTSSGPNYVRGYGAPNGAVWFNTYFNDYTNSLRDPNIGMHGFEGYLQGIGQALGLNFMGSYDYTQTSGPSSYQDSVVYSVMSLYGPVYINPVYHLHPWTVGTDYGESQVAWADWIGSNGWNYSPQTPMLNDVMAIQAVYGADPSTRTGDTVYGFNSNITDGTEAIFDFANNPNPILCIYDAAGTDTLDLSGFSAASRIDLAPGTYSDCADMTFNIAIARTAIIENATGGSGDDTISGNGVGNAFTGNGGADVIDGKGGADTLTGGSGNDALTGGAGDDTAVYAAAWTDLTVTYNAVTGVTTVSSASDGTDTLNGIETIVDGMGVAKTVASFMPEPDPVYSVTTRQASVTEGNSGTIAYNFTASLASASAQTRSAGWTLTFTSGTGKADSSDFSGTTSGTVSFAPGETTKTITVYVKGDTTVEANEAFSLSLTNPLTGTVIASAAGSITNDDTAPVATGLTINGNAFANSLSGSAGNDTINGGGGNDSITGLEGNDVIIGATGYDRMTGGAGADRFDIDTAVQTALISASTGKVSSSDVITDFTAGSDVIDLSTIDASTKILLNNAFTWIGTAAITTSTAGELRYQQFDNTGTDNDYTMIYGDVDADVLPELAIKLTGLVTLAATDFVL